MEVLMILLTISIIGIWTFVVYMNHLNKLIDKLEKKVGTLQWKTDNVLQKLLDCERRLYQLEEALELKEYFDKESLNKQIKRDYN